jgi:hypothetical protein
VTDDDLRALMRTKDLEFFGLGETTTAEQLREFWRANAPLWHPDRGGDSDLFRERLNTYRRLLAALAEPRRERCPLCLGEKFFIMLHGFYRLKVLCPECCGERSIPVKRA